MRYVLTFRDGPEGRSHIYHFGPFVSYTIVENFRNSLPQPLPGGSTKILRLEAYGYSEMGKAADLILGSRRVPA